jgi:predicted CoA-binding protein
LDLQQAMAQKVFVVVGNTVNPDKYAYIIKHRLLAQGYTVYCVGKELASINDVPEEIDVIDLCINRYKGIRLLKECTKSFKVMIIQPGAESDEILRHLDENKLPYMEACILVGLSLYKPQHRA